MKTVIILRAVSGAGKSTVAEYFKSFSPDTTSICCTDDFFCKPGGKYIFDAKLLGRAHRYCTDKFLNACESPIYNTIIIANTNAKQSDFQYYIDEAVKRGFQVFSLVVENRHGNVNTHNVPEISLVKQEQNIKGSLKLR